MIEILISLIVTFALGWCAGMLIMFVDFCIGSPRYGEVSTGRIFSSYGNIILQKYQQVEKRREQDVKNAISADPMAEKKHRAALYSRVNWWKPAGVCPICMVPYFVLPVFLCVWLVFSIHPVFGLVILSSCYWTVITQMNKG